MNNLIRNQYVLAVLSASDGYALSPVQVQKLFFLLDRKIADKIGGQKFNFSAYDYGPFDSSVYSDLETLAGDGLVEVLRSNHGLRQYRPTPDGIAKGRVLLNQMSEDVSRYIRDLSEWVRKLSFTDLVSSIYKEFPEMKSNSIFRY